jgi:hypothetical protein
MAETPSPAAKFPFDLESGDVLAFATYQGQRVSFKVSSDAMSLASPVWKKFLFPPFRRFRALHCLRVAMWQKIPKMPIYQPF